jgi:hypothetical protein
MLVVAAAGRIESIVHLSDRGRLVDWCIGVRRAASCEAGQYNCKGTDHEPVIHGIILHGGGWQSVVSLNAVCHRRFRDATAILRHECQAAVANCCRTMRRWPPLAASGRGGVDPPATANVHRHAHRPATGLPVGVQEASQNIHRLAVSINVAASVDLSCRRRHLPSTKPSLRVRKEKPSRRPQQPFATDEPREVALRQPPLPRRTPLSRSRPAPRSARARGR